MIFNNSAIFPRNKRKLINNLNKIFDSALGFYQDIRSPNYLCSENFVKSIN